VYGNKKSKQHALKLQYGAHVYVYVRNNSIIKKQMTWFTVVVNWLIYIYMKVRRVYIMVGIESLLTMAYRSSQGLNWKRVYRSLCSSFAGNSFVWNVADCTYVHMYSTIFCDENNICPIFVFLYVFLTYFYKCWEYVLILCAYCSSGNKTDLDFATGINLLYYKWFVLTIKRIKIVINNNN